jgi:four helix bundle protein
MTVQELQKRTRMFSLETIRLFKRFPATIECQIIGKQLLRSATSVTANYHAACRGRSTAEFIAKLSIVVEEADESLMWLEMIEEAAIYKGDEIIRLKQEARELLYIFSASRKSAKHNLESRQNATLKPKINKSTDQQIIQ